MYQVLHDTNNVTDSGCHCGSADQSSKAVGIGSVASTSTSTSELFTVVMLGPVFEIKAAISKSGNGVGRR